MHSGFAATSNASGIRTFVVWSPALNGSESGSEVWSPALNFLGLEICAVQELRCCRIVLMVLWLTAGLQGVSFGLNFLVKRLPINKTVHFERSVSHQQHS